MCTRIRSGFIDLTQDPDLGIAPLRLHAFGLLLHAYKTVVDGMEREMARSGVPLPEFQVLFRLMRAQDNRMQFRELAVSLIVSESRVSRLLQRMISRGYVHRENDPDDRRTTYAILTDEGREAFRRSAPSFAASLERNLSQQLTEGDLESLVHTLDIVIGKPRPLKQPRNSALRARAH